MASHPRMNAPQMVIHWISGGPHDDRMYESKPLWLVRFAVHSMALRSSMRMWAAARRAKRAYRYASNLPPEQAAKQDLTIPMWPSQRKLRP